MLQELFDSLNTQNRALLQSALSYSEDAVGAIIDFNIVTTLTDATLEVALRYMRRLGVLLDHTDKLFIVDKDDISLGVLPLKRLVVNDLAANVADVMAIDAVVFHPQNIADKAVKALDRYDLVTALVVDNNKLVVRVTFNADMDFIRDETESDLLSMAGYLMRKIFSCLFGSLYKTDGLGWLLI